MRRPLAWLIVLEILVVAALAAATYHVVATRWNAAPSGVAAAPTPSPTAKAAPLPTPRRATATPTPPPASSPTPRPSGPAPGLNLDPAFWAGQLGRVNRDQNALEQLQWRVTTAVTNWVRAYVDRVLLPAVREAERK
jgi:hypothetical protein